MFIESRGTYGYYAPTYGGGLPLHVSAKPTRPCAYGAHDPLPFPFGLLQGHFIKLIEMFSYYCHKELILYDTIMDPLI